MSEVGSLNAHVISSNKTEPLGFLSTLQELSNEPPQLFISELTLEESRTRLIKKLSDPLFRHVPNSENMEEIYRPQSVSFSEEEEILGYIHQGEITSNHFKGFLSHFRNQMQDIYPVTKESQSEAESNNRQQFAQWITRQALSYPESHNLFKYLWELNTPGVLSSMQSLDVDDIFRSNNIQKLTAIMKDFLLRKCSTVYEFQEQTDKYLNDNQQDITQDDLTTLRSSIAGLKTILYGAEQSQFLDAIVSLQKKAGITYVGESLDLLASKIDVSGKDTISTNSVTTSDLSLPNSDILKQEGRQFVII